MAEPTLAVLLRDGPHDSAGIRYALKCNDIAISYARTPIQIPIAQSSPLLIDLGVMRPSLTVTGVVDTIGGDTSNTDEGVAGMESFQFTRISVSLTGTSDFAWSDGGTSNATSKTYYIPYKNALEEAVGTWMYLSGETPLQVEIGDSKYPVGHGGFISRTGRGSTSSPGTSIYSSGNDSTHATGGAIYECAIQQGRFSLMAAREDRYDFTLQFVITRRLDIP